MKYKRQLLLLPLFFLIFTCTYAFTSENTPPLKPPPNPANPVKETIPANSPVSSPVSSAAAKTGANNIILLMDSSGSMKRTDPNSYRKPAAKLFVSLIGEETRISVLSFGDTVKTLLPLTENKKINRPKIESAIDRINSKEFSTHIHLAVKKGYEMLKETKEGNGILVLMSDGKLTLGSEEKDKAALAELIKLLPEIAKSGIRIYTLPFSEESDAVLLERIAKETGAFSRLAKTDKDIHIIFASIFEKIRSPDSIPLRDDGFTIDKDIKETILLITKQPKTKTTLINPKGLKMTKEKHDKDISWHSAEVFDMITITSPEHGSWKVNLSTKEGNRVYIITNLKLKSSFDKSFVYKGENIKIDAWLERDGGVIAEKDILDKITLVAESTDPSKKTQSIKMLSDVVESGAVPSKGIYTAHLAIDSIGDYTVRIIAEGSTFKREKTLEFKAQEPPPADKQPADTPKDAAAHPKGHEKNESGQWTQSLIIFGIANGAILLLGGAVFLVIKLLKKRTKAKKK